MQAELSDVIVANLVSEFCEHHDEFETKWFMVREFYGVEIEFISHDFGF